MSLQLLLHSQLAQWAHLAGEGVSTHPLAWLWLPNPASGWTAGKGQSTLSVNPYNVQVPVIYASVQAIESLPAQRATIHRPTQACKPM